MLKQVQHNVWRAWIAAFLFAILALPAHADPQFPPLTGRVVDAANLFTPEQRVRFDAKLTAIEQSTGRQFVIATIPDAQGYDLADYGYRLGRAWGIGEKGKNNGIVLFVAPNNPAGQRGPRIEVGYGLEPIVTDAFASVVAMGVMTPMLKNGDIGGAFDKGIDLIGEQIKLTPEEAAQRTAELKASVRPSGGNNGLPGSLFFWIFIFIFFILPMLRGFRGQRRHSSGLGDVILWTALNAAANSRDSDSGWGGGGGWGGGDGGDGFSGGGGSFGGGGASGGW